MMLRSLGVLLPLMIAGACSSTTDNTGGASGGAAGAGGTGGMAGAAGGGGSSGADASSGGSSGADAGSDAADAAPDPPTLTEVQVIAGGSGHFVTDVSIHPGSGHVFVLGYGSTSPGYESFIAELKPGQPAELPRRHFTSTDQAYAQGLVVGGNGALYLSGFFVKDLKIGSKTFAEPAGFGGVVARLLPSSGSDTVEGFTMLGAANQAFHGNAALGSGSVSVGFANVGATLHQQTVTTDVDGDGVISADFDGQPVGKHAVFGGAGTQRFYEVATDATPTIYAVGESAAFGPPLQVLGKGTLQLATLVAYDSTLKLLWARALGSASNDAFLDVAAGASGKQIVAVGYAKGQVDLGAGAPLPNAGAEDLLVAQFDGSGKLTWARTFGGAADDRAYSVAVHSTGDVFVSGSIKSASIDFGSGKLAKQGAEDGFILRLDSSGNVRFATLFGGAGTDFIGGLTASDDRVVAVGKFVGKLDFLGKPIAPVSTNPGFFDFAVLTLKP